MWLTPLVPALRRQRQADLELEASLVYTMSSRIAKPCLKKGGRGSQKTSLTSLAVETRALSPCKNAH